MAPMLKRPKYREHIHARTHTHKQRAEWNFDIYLHQQCMSEKCRRIKIEIRERKNEQQPTTTIKTNRGKEKTCQHRKNNNNMIMFLTLVGACHFYRHNLPFLGWLINKMYSNALRFYSASLRSLCVFSSFYFFAIFFGIPCISFSLRWFRDFSLIRFELTFSLFHIISASF